ncbi:MAG: PEP-CTERM system TPR-repeat protein PrsT [Azoarcus sp.]|jgi:putative PEP-CTERM system TPR-repeat lipoprotein|nr:PEP-CTERM system TPR-repeat protein PrsT [Azoarcus sp.]
MTVADFRRQLPARVRWMLAVALSTFAISACSSSPDQMISSAKDYIGKNDLNAAAIQLKNALQQNSQLPEGRYLLGTIYFKQENYAGAAKELQRAFDLGYAKDDVVPPLAHSLVRIGESGKVLRDFSALSLQAPAARARLEVARGDAQAIAKDYPAARKAYEAGLEADQNEESARIGLARLKLIERDARGAQTDAEAIVARAPEVAEAQLLLADTLMAQGKNADAVAPLRAVLKVRPEALATHRLLAMVLLNERDFERARAELGAMQRTAPTHPATRYVEAYLAFHDGKIDEARNLAVDAASKEQNFLASQLLAGMTLLRKNEFALAQSYFGRVLELSPNHARGRMLMVSALLGSGQAERARDTLLPLLARDQSALSAEQLGLAGQVYLANGDTAKGEAFFRRAAAAASEGAKPKLQMEVSRARMMSGDFDGALAILDEVSHEDPDNVRADLAKIAVHVRQREIDKALDVFRDIERKQPNEAQTYNLKGWLLTAKGEHASARAAYERALELRPDLLAAISGLANFDLADRKPAQARKRFEKLIGADSKNVDALLAYAGVLLGSGAKPDEIQTVLERAERAAPGQVAPSLAQAKFFLMRGDVARARDVADRAAASWPDDPAVLQVLGSVQLAAKDTQQAVSTFASLAGLRPKSAMPLLMLAEAQRAGGNASGADASVKKALTLEPANLQAQRMMIESLLAQKDFQGAVQATRTMQRQARNAEQGYTLEGDIYAEQGKTAEAIAAYDKAFKLGGRLEQFIRLHAALLRDQRNDEAQTLTQAWLAASPNDVAVRTYLAERELGAKRYGHAFALYQKITEIAPDNALALNNMAWTAFQLKDERALAYAERALALSPDNSAILDTLGTIQLERGQGKAGLANIERAVKLAPAQGVFRLSLAKAYKRLERREDARREVDVLLKSAPAGSPLYDEAEALLKNP